MNKIIEIDLVGLKGRVYFLSAGFSLAFGAMFTKTFRIHRIFARRNKLIKTKVISVTISPVD